MRNQRQSATPDGSEMLLISRHPFFRDVAAKPLARLIEACSVHNLAEGCVLLQPGQANRTLYVVLEGKLTIHIDQIDGEGGIAVAAGEYLGEISLVDGNPATAFVVAAEPCRILLIPDTVFWRDVMPEPQLAKNFMRMFADRFRARNESMKVALEQQLQLKQLERELEFAREIQSGLLHTKFSLAPEFDIVAEMIPMGQVGGDFYDVFPLDDENCCIAIGDVAGKGVPAALFMVRTITLLRTELVKSQSLERAVEELNRVICGDNPTAMFATLIVGVLNRRTGRFSYVDAGHHPAIVGTGGTRFEPQPLLHGIPVGILDDATYAAQSVDLKPGDVAFLHTDGVTEAVDDRNNRFGADRLLACLASDYVASAAELAGRVRTHIDAFSNGARQVDDLTMVIVRRCERGGL